MLRLKMNCAVVIAAAFFSSSSWAGCSFNWHHYGDQRVRDLADATIGSQVPDSFCPYAKNYQVVVISDYFLGKNGCQGYATASLRKMNSRKAPSRRASRLSYDTQCNNVDVAFGLAAKAVVDSVGDVMSELEPNIEAAKKLN